MSSSVPQIPHTMEVLRVCVFTVSVMDFNESADAVLGCYGYCS